MLNFTGTGTNRLKYRQIGKDLGIITAPFNHPVCAVPGGDHFYLSMYDRAWSEKSAQSAAYSTGTKFKIRIAPVYYGFIDSFGDYVFGWLNTESAEIQAGNEVWFEPFPIDKPCSGYLVFASKWDDPNWDGPFAQVQTYLPGRFNTRFTIDESGTPTITYDDTGDAYVFAEGIPPAFASTFTVFSTQGSNASRVFLGGGKDYSAGYVKVADADAASTLVSGDDIETTAATWAAIDDGALRIRINEHWHDVTGIDFTGDTDMDDVAATLQTALQVDRPARLYCGESPDSSLWGGTISDASLRIFAGGETIDLTSVDLSSAADESAVATAIAGAFTSGSHAVTCSWDGTRFIFALTGALIASGMPISFLESAGSGTDISALIKGTEATAEQLDLLTDTTNLTCANSSGVLTITHPTSGDDYRLSYIESPITGGGTDISAMLAMRSTDGGAAYTPGATANRTVLGLGTEWGLWCRGMRFRINSWSEFVTVLEYRDADHLVLSDDGPAADDWAEYLLTPFGNQLYVSTFNHPFNYLVSDIVSLPTEGDDAITVIERLENNIYVFMNSNIWVINGVDLQLPYLLSTNYGCPYPATMIRAGESLAFFSGNDFLAVRGGRVSSLDPEGRLKQIINNLSRTADDPHGVFLEEDGRSLGIWFVGYGDVDVYNAALVFDFRTSAWWMWWLNDANASAVMQQVDGVRRLITGTRAHDEYGVPALVFQHDQTYRSDGADEMSVPELIVSTAYDAVASPSLLVSGVVSNNAHTGWTAIVSGSLMLPVDGAQYELSGMDFSSAADMDDVADVLQAALIAAGCLGITVEWDSGDNQFTITSPVSGAGSSVGYAAPYFSDSEADTYVGGRDWFAMESADGAAITKALDYMPVRVTDMDGAAVDLDGEEWLAGLYAYLCSTDMAYGEYLLCIEAVPSVYTLTNAGTASANATYTISGTANGRVKYTEPDGGYLQYTGTQWGCYSAADALLYYSASTAFSPPIDGWTASTGSAPVPTVAYGDMDVLLVSPGPSAGTVAGMYLFVGGIVPTWMKWFDFGSPHRKSKVFSVSVTADPVDAEHSNLLGILTMQEFDNESRTSDVVNLTGSDDAVHTIKVRDRTATQTAIMVIRPSSRHPLTIEDITVTHRPE